ncbi:AAA family ATPase [Elusimicrobiota bacterium]
MFIRSIAVTLITALLITVPGIAPYQVLAAMSGPKPVPNINTEALKVPNNFPEINGSIPMTEKAGFFMSRIDQALDSLGIDPDQADKSVLFDFKKDELLENGAALLLEGKAPSDIREIWRKMAQAGINDPTSIPLELIYDFDKEIPTIYAQDLIRFSRKDPLNANDTVSQTNAVFHAYASIPKNIDPKAYADMLNKIFDSLDLLKEEHSQMAVATNWIEDTMAPGFRYSTGVMGDDGKVRAGEVNILPDGTVTYIEFERDIPVRLIVKTKDPVTGKEEVNAHILGFNKQGNMIVPIGLTDTKLIQLMPGGAFVEVPQKRTTAKELEEQRNKEQESIFNVIMKPLAFAANMFVRGPVGLMAVGISRLIALNSGAVTTDWVVKMNEWGTATTGEAYNSVDRVVTETMYKLTGNEWFASVKGYNDMAHASSTQGEKQVIQEHAQQAGNTAQAKPHLLSGMRKDVYESTVEPVLEVWKQVDDYASIFSQTGWDGLPNHLNEEAAILTSEADRLAGKGKAYDKQVKELERQAKRKRRTATVITTGQTAAEMLALTVPITSSVKLVSKALAGALPKTAPLQKLAHTVPHLIPPVTMVPPLVLSTYHSYREAQRLKQKLEDHPDQIVGREIADMNNHSRNVTAMVTTILGLGVLGRASGNRAKSKAAAATKAAAERGAGTRSPPSSVKEAWDIVRNTEFKTPEGKTVRVTDRSGQVKTSEIIFENKNPDAGTGTGKTLAANIALAAETGKIITETGKRPAMEVVVPSKLLVEQALKGDVAGVKIREIESALGMEAVDGAKLFESYQRGDPASLMKAYEQGKKIYYDKESFGHLKTAMDKDPFLNKTVIENTKKVLIDEPQSFFTEKTDFITSDGKSNVKQAQYYAQRYQGLYNEIEAINPKEVSPKTFARMTEPAVVVDPVSNRVIKNRALERALKDKGYEGGEIDQMLYARHVPEVVKPWAIEKANNATKATDANNAKNSAPTTNSQQPSTSAKLYPRGADGIQWNSKFSSKALEVGAYLREVKEGNITLKDGVKLSDMIEVNQTSASSTLLEAILARKNANISGMSGSLEVVKEMVRAGIGSEVVSVKTKAPGKRETTVYNPIKPDLTSHVKQMALDAVKSAEKGRGALVCDLKHSKAIERMVKELSPDAKTYRIDDATSKAKIVEITRNAGKEKAIVFTNKRAIEGADFKGDIDVLVNADHLNSFNSIQAMGRGGRSKGTVTRASFYYTQDTLTTIKDFMGKKANKTLKKAMIEKLGKAEDPVIARAYEKALKGRNLSSEQAIKLANEVNLIKDKSSAAFKLINEGIDYLAVDSVIKQAALMSEEASLSGAKKVLDTTMRKLLNGEIGPGEAALKELSYDNPLKVADNAFAKAKLKADAVFPNLIKELSSKKGTKKITNYLKNHVKNLEAIEKIGTENIVEAPKGSLDSFKYATSLKEVIAVSKKLARETVLPQLKTSSSRNAAAGMPQSSASSGNTGARPPLSSASSGSRMLKRASAKHSDGTAEGTPSPQPSPLLRQGYGASPTLKGEGAKGNPASPSSVIARSNATRQSQKQGGTRVEETEFISSSRKQGITASLLSPISGIHKLIQNAKTRIFSRKSKRPEPRYKGQLIDDDPLHPPSQRSANKEKTYTKSYPSGKPKKALTLALAATAGILAYFGLPAAGEAAELATQSVGSRAAELIFVITAAPVIAIGMYRAIKGQWALMKSGRDNSAVVATIETEKMPGTSMAPPHDGSADSNKADPAESLRDGVILDMDFDSDGKPVYIVEQDGKRHMVIGNREYYTIQNLTFDFGSSNSVYFKDTHGKKVAIIDGQAYDIAHHMTSSHDGKPVYFIEKDGRQVVVIYGRIYGAIQGLTFTFGNKSVRFIETGWLHKDKRKNVIIDGRLYNIVSASVFSSGNKPLYAKTSETSMAAPHKITPSIFSRISSLFQRVKGKFSSKKTTHGVKSYGSPRRGKNVPVLVLAATAGLLAFFGLPAAGEAAILGTDAAAAQLGSDIARVIGDVAEQVAVVTLLLSALTAGVFVVDKMASFAARGIRRVISDIAGDWNSSEITESPDPLAVEEFPESSKANELALSRAGKSAGITYMNGLPLTLAATAGILAYFGLPGTGEAAIVASEPALGIMASYGTIGTILMICCAALGAALWMSTPRNKVRSAFKKLASIPGKLLAKARKITSDIVYGFLVRMAGAGLAASVVSALSYMGTQVPGLDSFLVTTLALTMFGSGIIALASFGFLAQVALETIVKKTKEPLSKAATAIKAKLESERLLRAFAQISVAASSAAIFYLASMSVPAAAAISSTALALLSTAALGITMVLSLTFGIASIGSLVYDTFRKNKHATLSSVTEDNLNEIMDAVFAKKSGTTAREKAERLESDEKSARSMNPLGIQDNIFITPGNDGFALEHIESNDLLRDLMFWAGFQWARIKSFIRHPLAPRPLARLNPGVMTAKGWAYKVGRSKRNESIIVDDEMGPVFSAIRSMGISADRKFMAYIGIKTDARGKRVAEYPVINQVKGPAFNKIEDLYFDSKGNLIIKGTHKGENGIWAFNKLSEEELLIALETEVEMSEAELLKFKIAQLAKEASSLASQAVPSDEVLANRAMFADRYGLVLTDSGDLSLPSVIVSPAQSVILSESEESKSDPSSLTQDDTGSVTQDDRKDGDVKKSGIDAQFSWLLASVAGILAYFGLPGASEAATLGSNTASFWQSPISIVAVTAGVVAVISMLREVLNHRKSSYSKKDALPDIEVVTEQTLTGGSENFGKALEKEEDVIVGDEKDTLKKARETFDANESLQKERDALRKEGFSPIKTEIVGGRYTSDPVGWLKEVLLFEIWGKQVSSSYFTHMLLAQTIIKLISGIHPQSTGKVTMLEMKERADPPKPDSSVTTTDKEDSSSPSSPPGSKTPGAREGKVKSDSSRSAAASSSVPSPLEGEGSVRGSAKAGSSDPSQTSQVRLSVRIAHKVIGKVTSLISSLRSAAARVSSVALAKGGMPLLGTNEKAAYSSTPKTIEQFENDLLDAGFGYQKAEKIITTVSRRAGRIAEILKRKDVDVDVKAHLRNSPILAVLLGVKPMADMMLMPGMIDVKALKQTIRSIDASLDVIEDSNFNILVYDRRAVIDAMHNATASLKKEYKSLSFHKELSQIRVNKKFYGERLNKWLKEFIDKRPMDDRIGVLFGYPLNDTAYYIAKESKGKTRAERAGMLLFPGKNGMDVKLEPEYNGNIIDYLFDRWEMWKRYGYKFDKKDYIQISYSDGPMGYFIDWKAEDKRADLTRQSIAIYETAFQLAGQVLPQFSDRDAYAQRALEKGVLLPGVEPPSPPSPASSSRMRGSTSSNIFSAIKARISSLFNKKDMDPRLREDDTEDGPAFRLSGKGLTKAEHKLINKVIALFFTQGKARQIKPSESLAKALRNYSIQSIMRQPEILTESDKEYLFYDPNGDYFAHGTDIYVLDGETEINRLAKFAGISPPSDIVAHAGRTKNQVYYFAHQKEFLEGLSEIERRQVARHKIEQIENPDKPDEVIQAIAPSLGHSSIKGALWNITPRVIEQLESMILQKLSELPGAEKHFSLFDSGKAKLLSAFMPDGIAAHFDPSDPSIIYLNAKYMESTVRELLAAGYSEKRALELASWIWLPSAIHEAQHRLDFDELTRTVGLVQIDVEASEMSAHAAQISLTHAALQKLPPDIWLTRAGNNDEMIADAYKRGPADFKERIASVYERFKSPDWNSIHPDIGSPEDIKKFQAYLKNDLDRFAQIFQNSKPKPSFISDILVNPDPHKVYHSMPESLKEQTEKARKAYLEDAFAASKDLGNGFRSVDINDELHFVVKHNPRTVAGKIMYLGPRKSYSPKEKSTGLSSDTLEALHKAANDDYTVTILKKNLYGTDRFVVLLGETHLKSKTSSEIGKELIRKFRYIGGEGVNFNSYAGMRIFSKIIKSVFHAFYRTFLPGRSKEQSTINDAYEHVLDMETDAATFAVKTHFMLLSAEERHKMEVGFDTTLARDPDALANIEDAATGKTSQIRLDSVKKILAELRSDPGSPEVARVRQAQKQKKTEFFRLEAGHKPDLAEKLSLWFKTLFPLTAGLLSGRNKTMARNIYNTAKNESELESMLAIVGKNHTWGLTDLLIKDYGFEIVATNSDIKNISSPARSIVLSGKRWIETFGSYGRQDVFPGKGTSAMVIVGTEKFYAVDRSGKTIVYFQLSKDGTGITSAYSPRTRSELQYYLKKMQKHLTHEQDQKLIQELLSATKGWFDVKVGKIRVSNIEFDPGNDHAFKKTLQHEKREGGAIKTAIKTKPGKAFTLVFAATAGLLAYFGLPGTGEAAQEVGVFGSAGIDFLKPFSALGIAAFGLITASSLNIRGYPFSGDGFDGKTGKVTSLTGNVWKLKFYNRRKWPVEAKKQKTKEKGPKRGKPRDYVEFVPGKGRRATINGKEGQIFDSIYNIQFSPDKKRYLYQAQLNFKGAKEKHYVVVDGKAGEAYDYIDNVAFSSDFKHVTYRGYRGPSGRRKVHIVIDDVASPAYTDVWEAHFSPQGKHSVYVAEKGKNNFIVVDEEPGPGLDGEALSLLFSPDGNRLAYTLRSYAMQGNALNGGKVAKDQAVVDGEPGLLVDSVWHKLFSPDSKHFAYIAKLNGMWYVFYDGIMGPEFEKIDDMRFTSDNELAVKGEYAGKKGIWILEPTSEKVESALNKVPQAMKGNNLRRRRAKVNFSHGSPSVIVSEARQSQDRGDAKDSGNKESGPNSKLSLFLAATAGLLAYFGLPGTGEAAALEAAVSQAIDLFHTTAFVGLFAGLFLMVVVPPVMTWLFNLSDSRKKIKDSAPLAAREKTERNKDITKEKPEQPDKQQKQAAKDDKLQRQAEFLHALLKRIQPKGVMEPLKMQENVFVMPDGNGWTIESARDYYGSYGLAAWARLLWAYVKDNHKNPEMSSWVDHDGHTVRDHSRWISWLKGFHYDLIADKWILPGFSKIRAIYLNPSKDFAVVGTYKGKRGTWFVKPLANEEVQALLDAEAELANKGQMAIAAFRAKGSGKIAGSPAVPTDEALANRARFKDKYGIDVTDLEDPSSVIARSDSDEAISKAGEASEIAAPHLLNEDKGNEARNDKTKRFKALSWVPWVLAPVVGFFAFFGLPSASEAASALPQVAETINAGSSLFPILASALGLSALRGWIGGNSLSPSPSLSTPTPRLRSISDPQGRGIRGEGEGDLPGFGLEFELASENFMEVDAAKNIGHYPKLLEVIKEGFGGGGSEISIEPWEKYPERNFKKAVYSDPMGRQWQVVPEAVNTTGWDGFELVTPPLKTQQDIKGLSYLMDLILKTKEFGRGIRSSTHFTFDASHLIDPDGNASRLVDTILFIENNWKEIYSAVGTKRYGSTVNRFSVPLAAQQKGLLNELADMPTEQRTFSTVKALFERYNGRELRLKDRNEGKAWKYRAANYKKIFGLLGEKQKPIIEFRIGDLDDSSTLVKNLTLLRQIVADAWQIEKNAKFRDPFKGRTHNDLFDDLNKRIYNLEAKKYAQFIESVGFSISEYPNLIERPSLGLSEQTIKALTDNIDTSKPMGDNSGNITFGWEAEFRGSRSAKVLKDDLKAPRLDRFPYLSRHVSRELTGNHEIRSNGGDERLKEVIAQMKHVKKTLKSDLRGFHLHMRVPKSMVADIPFDEFASWVRRIGDYIFFWRLQHRMHFFALKVTTQKRPSAQVHSKNAIKLDSIGNSYDIEIRGFMSDIGRIEDLAKMIMVGLKYKKLIKGNFVNQIMMSVYPHGLQKLMEKFVKKYHHRDLTDEERMILFELRNATLDGPLPLIDFENAAYLSRLERMKVAIANFVFQKELYTVLQNAVSGKYPDKQERHKQYRWRIKKWARNINMAALLRKSILMHTGNDSSLLSLEDKMQTALRAEENSPARKSATKAFYAYNLKAMLDLIAKYFDNEDESVRLKMIGAMQKSGSARVLELIKKALKDKSVRVRENAVLLLPKFKIYQYATSIMEEALGNESYLVRLSAASIIENMMNKQDNKDMLPLIRKALEDENAGVREYAAKALEKLSGHEALELMEKALWDEDPVVRHYAIEVLLHDPDKGTAIMAKTAFQHEPSETRDQVYKALGSVVRDNISGALSVSIIKNTAKLWSARSKTFMQELFDTGNADRLIAEYVLSQPQWQDRIDWANKIIERDYAVHELVKYALSKEHWKEHPELIAKLIENGKELRTIAHNALAEPHWADHPEFVEALIKRQNPDIWTIAESVLSKPHWKDHPGLLEMAIKTGKEGNALAKYVFSQPHWKDHPELLKMLIEGDASDEFVIAHTLSKPHWIDHPEFVKTLIEKERNHEYIAQFVLSKSHWKDHPEWMETIIDQGKADWAIAKYALSKPHWKEHLEWVSKIILNDKAIGHVEENVLTAEFWPKEWLLFWKTAISLKLPARKAFMENYSPDSKDPLQMMYEALDDESAAVRKYALYMVSGHKGLNVLWMIEKALEDKDDGVRSIAARSLIGRDDPVTLRLTSKALEDRSTSVRSIAAEVLMKRKDQGALPLIEKALGDKQADVRKPAALALSNHDEPQVLRIIEKALKDEKSDIREIAAEWLIDRDEPEALRLIEKALEDEDPRVRQTAASAFIFRAGPEILHLLRKALADEDESVRKTAIEALKSREDPQSAELLAEHAESIVRRIPIGSSENQDDINRAMLGNAGQLNLPEIIPNRTWITRRELSGNHIIITDGAGNTAELSRDSLAELGHALNRDFGRTESADQGSEEGPITQPWEEELDPPSSVRNRTSSWLPWLLAPTAALLAFFGLPEPAAAATIAAEPSPAVILNLIQDLFSVSPSSFISPFLSLSGLVAQWLSTFFSSSFIIHHSSFLLSVILNSFQDLSSLSSHIFSSISSLSPKPLALSLFALLGMARPSSDQNTPEPPPAPQLPEYLSKYTIDVTHLAEIGKIDPITGRDREVLDLMETLLRRTKPNAILIGEAGVGKTAIVEGLAQKIADGDVPHKLQGKRILSLQVGQTVGGTSMRGSFEERMTMMVEELMENPDYILFIDEMHTMVGSGKGEGNLDIAGILKPAMARGDLRIIGASTYREYRQYIEKDAALKRRINPIHVDEPTEEGTFDILKTLAPRYAMHHNVKFSIEALKAAATMAKRYLTDKFLPDSAIDLMDKAGAKDSLLQRPQLPNTETPAPKEITREDIAKVVAQMTNIPAEKLSASQSEKLINLEDELRERVIGQEDAKVALADAVRRAYVGLSRENGPMGSFLFLGPTGVGKTETARALAEALFGSDDALIKVDMSEYAQPHQVARLIGAPPGYVGYDEAGDLTEKIRRKPYSIVLFDEIDKAHPQVLSSLLQVLEDGVLTDGQGRKVDFSNTYVIMTSNQGSELFQSKSSIGFLNSGQESKNVKDAVLAKLRQSMKPEFFNRIDETIIFDMLTDSEKKEILDLELAKLEKRLKKERSIELKISDKAKEAILSQGFDPTLGARPLRRAIQNTVEAQLAKEILKHEDSKKQITSISVDQDPEDPQKLVFKPKFQSAKKKS